MKREKTKNNVLKTQGEREGARRRLSSAKPASADAQTPMTSEIPLEFIATAAKPDREPQILDSQQTGETASSLIENSSETAADIVVSTGKTLQRLAFLLGDEEYGIDIRMVREIIRLTDITPVPRAPSYIQGIISLRGTVLPILDLCRLLSMPDSKLSKKARILVVNLEEVLVGIIVDEVTEVVELKEEELEPPPTLMMNAVADHIIGMGRYKGRLIILLDVKKVYLARNGMVKSVQG